jgi:Ni/Co efflux regulator RcnB
MRKALIIAVGALSLICPTLAVGQSRTARESPHARANWGLVQVAARENRGQVRGRDRAPGPARAAPPASRRNFGPGQVLPPAVRASPLQDLPRYRLRTPPPGYDWVQVGRDIYLMQRSTGMVLEVVPGGY